MTNSKISFQAKCKLPTQWGMFDLYGFLDTESGKEHLAVVMGKIEKSQRTLLRLHSECMTGDALFSVRCDCGAQLQRAMEKIARNGSGVLLYLRQEGRGIGLFNKLKAYELQDQGADTVEANLAMGFEEDMRQYDFCKEILEYLGVGSISLLSNNPRKIKALEQMGFNVSRREHQIIAGDHNRHYLETKRSKLGHLLINDIVKAA